ncbi:MAG: hypothetical protein AB7E32_14120 [Desulfovibrio sp.]
MPKPNIDRTALIGGPYRAPDVEIGDWIMDARFGLVPVGGWTNALIPWPRRAKAGRHSLILCGDLIRAVETESGIAVAHHWGVSVHTVTNWRRTLDVSHTNAGTARLYQAYKPAKLPEEAAERGREAAKSDEARAKLSAAKSGKPAHPNTLAALKLAAQRPKSAKWRADNSRRMREQWGKGIRKKKTDWSDGEILTALNMHVSGLSNNKISSSLGKPQQSVDAVLKSAMSHSFRLWINTYKSRRAQMAEEVSWDEIDTLLGIVPDRTLAALSGYTSNAIGQRRIKNYIEPVFGLGKWRDDVDWTLVDARLGKVSDSQLARELGVAQGAVWTRRTKKGIPPYKNDSGTPQKRTSRPRASNIAWEQYDHMLGTMPDVQLAKIIGCSRVSVNKRRRELGVPAYSPSATLDQDADDQ